MSSFTLFHFCTGSDPSDAIAAFDWVVACRQPRASDNVQ